jgi:uncharacterized membrane protein YhhN
MDGVTAALVAGFLVLAAADWHMVWHGHDGRRLVTKTAATVALVLVAAVAGEMDGGARIALVVAVVLCLVGDVALLGDSDERFLLGLGAFAAGHVAYTVTALVIGVSWPRAAVAVPVLALLLAFEARSRMFNGARRAGGTPMLVSVAMYTLIISAMVVSAAGTPSWLAFAGATLFAISDATIAYDRFVAPIRRADLPIMVTYHVGQLLLVLGLIAGG